MLRHLHGFACAHGEDDVSGSCDGGKMLRGLFEGFKVLRFHGLSTADGITQLLCTDKACIRLSCGIDGEKGQAVHTVEALHEVVKKSTGSSIGMGLEHHMDLSVVHSKDRIDGAGHFTG